MSLLPSLGDEQWFDIITTVSLLSAAGFGLLALLTDYKKDGSITRWGRIAAAGIVGSAILSIMSGVFNDRIDAGATAKTAVKAAVQQTREASRFNAQIARLLSLQQGMTTANRHNEQIIAAMRNANAVQRALGQAQAVLLAQSQSSLLLTAKVDSEQRASSQRVMKGLWDEANRIEAARVELIVSVDCELAEGQAAPAIFAESSTAGLIVRPASEGPFDHGNASGAHGMENLDFKRTLFSYEPLFRRVTIGGGQTVIFFRSFLSFNPESVADPEVWRDGSIWIFISGAAPDGLEKVRWRESTIGGDKALLPCSAGMLMTINGRMLGSANGRLTIDRDDEGTLTTRVEGEMAVEKDVFPRYRGATVK